MTELEETFADKDHIRSARSVARASIVALLVIGFCDSAASMYFIKHHLQKPGALTISFFVLVMVFTYVWYYYDAMERSYTRSRGLNLAVILLAIVSIPYYLARSRPQGQRLRAGFRLIGFFFCYLISAVLGALLVLFVGVF